ncbi:MAG: YihY family inner membrane protein [Bradymonadaceae bacterium]
MFVFENITARWREFLVRFDERPWEERRLGDRAIVVSIALVYMTVRETMRDRGAVLAGNLAFLTVLSVVPLLSVAVSLMAAFGLFEEESNLLIEPLLQVFPSTASGIVSYLGQMAMESAQAIGGIGGITLIIIGVVLFNHIEQAFTHIWRGSHDRSIVRKFLTFYALITFGPVLIALSVIESASFQIYLGEMGLDVGLFKRFLPLVYTLIVFTLMNKLLPNARVRWSAALVGGLVTAVAFEFAKWGFNLYINQMLVHTYNRVYGALTLIPLFLIWVYITWLVILIGAEISYSFQHLRSLIKAEAGETAAQIRHGTRKAFNPVMGVEVFSPIAAAFKQGLGATEEATIVRSTRYSARIVTDIIDVLIEEGFLVESKQGKRGHRWLLPGRPLEDIGLEEIVEAFWIGEGQSGPMEAIHQGYHRSTRNYFAAYRASDLVVASGDGDIKKGGEPSTTVEETPPSAKAPASAKAPG